MKYYYNWMMCRIYFYAGHMCSIVMHWHDCLGCFYRPYNWLMLKSFDIDEKYETGIWVEDNPTNE